VEGQMRSYQASGSSFDAPELSCRGKTKSLMSRMALRWKDSDHGAEAELRAEKRATEESSCAGRMVESCD